MTSKRGSLLQTPSHFAYQKTSPITEILNPGQLWNQGQPLKVTNGALTAAVQGCPRRGEAKASGILEATHERGYVPAVRKWCRICKSRGRQISTPFRPRGSQLVGRRQGEEPHLAAGGRSGSVNSQLPGARGEHATPSLGKRTKRVGGLGLGMPPSSPSAGSFLWFQAASAGAWIPHSTAASSKAALPFWGIERGQQVCLLLTDALVAGKAAAGNRPSSPQQQRVF